ncbi:hypothetical protein MN608_02687 [Microdochium nivale]|nr:hypothetical protein MN608_02687 [Microdochium nivale]
MGHIHTLADFRNKPKRRCSKDNYRVQKRSHLPWSRLGPEYYRIVEISLSHELRRFVAEWARYSIVHRRIRWLMAEDRVFIAAGCMADPEGIILDVEDATDFEDIGPDGQEVGAIGHSNSSSKAEQDDNGQIGQCRVDMKMVGIFTLQDLFDKCAGKLPSKNIQHHRNGTEIRLSKLNSMIIAEWLRLIDCEFRLQSAENNWRSTIARNAIGPTENVNTTMDKDQQEPKDETSNEGDEKNSDCEVDDTDLVNVDADIDDLEPLGLDGAELGFWTEIYGDVHLAAHALAFQPNPPEDSDEPAPHVFATFGFSQERFMICDT